MTLCRAYSVFEIKAVDDKSRTVQGIATTPTPDRMDDIIDPLGAKFQLPIPMLWQHDSNCPVGRVEVATPNKAGIPFTTIVEQTDEPGPVKDRLDSAWQDLNLRLVRGVSIGFRPLKYSFLENGGIEFQEWEWLELSFVTIPANSEAIITTIKSLDRDMRLKAGISDPIFPQPDPLAATGKSTRIVKLDDPARAGAMKPFVIRDIRRTR